MNVTQLNNTRKVKNNVKNILKIIKYKKHYDKR